MLLAIASIARAAEPEEIIVYGDPFARWRGTRWLVEADLLQPLGATFAADANRSFGTHLFQIRAVLACDLEGEGKKRADVGCEIEDIAVLPTTVRDFATAEQRDRADDVVRALDAKLTGMTVQIQVDAAGGVTNFDLEGVDASNLRERELQETMREIVGRAVAGFHVRVPDQYRGGGEWAETHSALMDLSGLVGSRGSSTLVHRLSLIDGHPILQTAGEGSAAISVPSYMTGLFEAFAGRTEGGGLKNADLSPPPMPTETGDQQWAPPGLAGGAGMPPPPSMNPPDPNIVPGGNMLLVEATYALTASGVGVYDDGVLSERVWVVQGTPSPSSPVQVPYFNRGRIYKLTETQHPDLGPSRQVAYPGSQMEGLPAYPPLL